MMILPVHVGWLGFLLNKNIFDVVSKIIMGEWKLLSNMQSGNILPDHYAIALVDESMYRYIGLFTNSKRSASTNGPEDCYWVFQPSDLNKVSTTAIVICIASLQLCLWSSRF